jgi:hypothetical protein
VPAAATLFRENCFLAQPLPLDGDAPGSIGVRLERPDSPRVALASSRRPGIGKLTGDVLVAPSLIPRKSGDRIKMDRHEGGGSLLTQTNGTHPRLAARKREVRWCALPLAHRHPQRASKGSCGCRIEDLMLASLMALEV